MGKKSEEWSSVFGFEDEYLISSFGVVKNKKTQKVLKPGSNGKYLNVHLWKNRKLAGVFYIHRLVLMSFGFHPLKGQECAHLDGNRNNNSLENLKWVTPKENNEHKKLHGTYLFGDKHACAKIKDKDCIEILKLFISGHSTEYISKIYGISSFAINHILSNKSRKHVFYCPAITAIVKKVIYKKKVKTAAINKRRSLGYSDSLSI